MNPPPKWLAVTVSRNSGHARTHKHTRKNLKLHGWSRETKLSKPPPFQGSFSGVFVMLHGLDLCPGSNNGSF